MTEVAVGGQEQDLIIENPVNALDLVCSLPEGGWLKVLGVDKIGVATPIGEVYQDVKFILKQDKNSNREESVRFIGDRLVESIPLDKDQLKTLLQVLVRQGDEWVTSMYLEDMLSFALDNLEELPNPKNSGWSLDQEKEWVLDLISQIDLHDTYWREDEENHRQDGPKYYDEWVRDIRGGY